MSEAPLSLVPVHPWLLYPCFLVRRTLYSRLYPVLAYCWGIKKGFGSRCEWVGSNDRQAFDSRAVQRTSTRAASNLPSGELKCAQAGNSVVVEVSGGDGGSTVPDV